MNVAAGKAVTVGAALLTTIAPAQAAPVIFSDAGDSAADIADTVEAFQARLSQTGGTVVNNGVGGGPFTTGIRYVDWDLVPAAHATGDTMPGDFFNTEVPVGVVLSTFGEGFLVSAKPGEGLPLRFGDINPQYETIFQGFEGDRLFSPNLSTITDVTFYVPGDPDFPAFVHGFGAVFSDVDNPGGLRPTALEFWDTNGRSLGHFQVEAADNGLSFLGVWFDGPEAIGRVRITNGNVPPFPGTNDGLNGVDIVALGPLFFSEPLAIPEPGTGTLLALGMLGWLIRRR